MPALGGSKGQRLPLITGAKTRRNTRGGIDATPYTGANDAFSFDRKLPSLHFVPRISPTSQYFAFSLSRHLSHSHPSSRAIALDLRWLGALATCEYHHQIAPSTFVTSWSGVHLCPLERSIPTSINYVQSRGSTSRGPTNWPPSFHTTPINAPRFWGCSKRDCYHITMETLAGRRWSRVVLGH